MPPTQQDIYTTELDRRCSLRSASSCPYYEEPIIFTDYSLLRKIGIFGTISSSSCKNEKSNAITLTVLFPWILGSRAFTAQLLLKSLKCSVFKSTLSRGLLSVRNVVPDESRIMIACEQGDIPVVQQLLQTMTASPHDITRAGRTPLLVRFWNFCYYLS